jgi:hypothetical protein
MKSFIATTIITLSLLASSANAGPTTSNTQPTWAQQAFVGSK